MDKMGTATANILKSSSRPTHWCLLKTNKQLETYILYQGVLSQILLNGGFILVIDYVRM
tara:strand:- start:91 stop:267 length:177 start_codon:yes stop_codon:yes gene_type:complete